MRSFGGSAYQQGQSEASGGGCTKHAERISIKPFSPIHRFCDAALDFM
jgi:hypothetical protein